MVTRRGFILGSLGGLAALYFSQGGVLVPADPALAGPTAAGAGNPDWDARHGLTAAQYQDLVDEKSAQGWRPIDVSGYEEGGQVRYATIWERSDGPEWVARHGLDAQQHQAAFDQLLAQGFRLVRVNGYKAGDGAQFASIWHKTAGRAWLGRHNLTGEQFDADYDTLPDEGWRLVDISGYEDGGQIKFTAIWDKSAGAWAVYSGMSSEGFQARFNELTGQGYRLARVSGYQSGGQATYAAIWDRRLALPYQARHGVAATQYQGVFKDITDDGLRPVQVVGYRVGTGAQFAGIWQRPRPGDAQPAAIAEAVHRFMDSNSVPGLSLAIVKDERLAYALSYGYADVARETPVTRTSLFRIASLSKAITSAAIYRLVEAGELELTDNAFGPNGILGTGYGTPPYIDATNNARVESITIRHLLEHNAGVGWSNDSPDPMFLQNALTANQLIGWVLDNRPLNSVPGEAHRYSNFGYCVLGRVIEKVSGQTYEAYVRQSVLAPAGITAMTIGGNNRAQRKPNEVAYYDQHDDIAYAMNVSRMDAHGGWLASAVDIARFIVRVDGRATKPDVLQAGTITTMTTGSTPNPRYASGWGVNGGTWDHNGGLPGTSTVMVRRADGITWVVLTNTERVIDKAGLSAAMYGLMDEILATIRVWPSGDQF
jgi:CubicO group peptidase (beta-lactamase class C family)